MVLQHGARVSVRGDTRLALRGYLNGAYSSCKLISTKVSIRARLMCVRVVVSAFVDCNYTRHTLHTTLTALHYTAVRSLLLKCFNDEKI